jgi:hypothetical protein
VGILERELDRDHGRQGQRPGRGDHQGRDDDRRQDNRGQGKQNGEKERQEREETKKEPLRKREPVRLAGAVVPLITAGALALFGYEVTAEQQVMLNDLLLLIIPVIVPVVAGFEVARSKVDSPATVERKMKEERQR